MQEVVEGLKFRHLDNLTDQLEMDDDVISYESEKTGENEYKVIITKKEKPLYVGGEHPLGWLEKKETP